MTSLKTRLVLTVSALAIAATLAAALSVRWGTRREFVKFQDEERRLMSQELKDSGERLARSLDGKCCDRFDELIAGLGPQEFAFVIRADNTVAATGGPAARSLRNVEIGRDGSMLTLKAQRPIGEHIEQMMMRIIGMGHPFTLADGTPAHLYLLQFPDEQERARDTRAARFLLSIDRTVLVGVALAGLAAIAATWLLARRGLAPLDALRDASSAIARGELSRRVAVESRDEIGDLARAFNSMAEQLERQHQLRRDQLHDVAHELRTPLTALRCRIETIADGLAADPKQSLEGAHEEVVHLGRLVDDLQELALADARELRIQIADTPLTPVITSALTAAGLQNDPRVTVDVPPGAAVRADVVRLRQILLNLLTNADRHAPAGARIDVRAVEQPEAVRVEVANTGSALDAEQRARVFDRFYRTDPSRQRATGGSGLGLAIVKSLVEAQGGSVWVDSSGDRVVFGFSLPRGIVNRT